ncbi:hypothetical protein [Chitinimonas sp. JJ19]|uniref:hypothetical protein n=1 Tax=Chitinimonas sp. JJ19 TaxID=3109352 RepID=UPI0030015883
MTPLQNNPDTPLDFQLKRKEDVHSGLTMELVPGLFNDAAARAETLYLDEDAFAFIESGIKACWPAYAHYGHWGLSEIPSDIWRLIVTHLLTLQRRLMVATSADGFDECFLFDDVREYFYRYFDRLRPKVIQFISEVIAWLESYLICRSHISVNGV